MNQKKCIFFIVASMLLILTEANSQVKDYGMTSSAHSKYVGQIVFSKSPIWFQNEDENSFENTFVRKVDKTDEVYFMAYFPRSCYNQAIKDGTKPVGSSGKIIFTFYLNGVKINNTAEMSFNGEEFKEWTGLSFPGCGINNFSGSEPFNKLFLEEVLPKIKEYENKIRFEITFKTKISGFKDWSPSSPIASGEFTFLVEEFMKGRLMPKAEIEITKAQEDNFKKALKNDKHEVLRVVLVEPEWTPIRNQISGALIGREIRVAAAVKYKNGEHWVNFYYVSQDYLGDKFSEKVIYQSITTGEYKIDANDVYK